MLDFHRSDKPVAAARNGFYETRIIGVVTERLPQLGDRRSQALPEIDKGVLRPQMLPDDLSIDDRASVLKEKNEQLKWLILQLNPVPIPEELPRLGKDFKGAKAVDGTVTRGADHGSPPERITTP